MDPHNPMAGPTFREVMEAMLPHMMHLRLTSSMTVEEECQRIMTACDNAIAGGGGAQPIEDDNASRYDRLLSVPLTNFTGASLWKAS